uniref:Transthyretin-like family protein n=1 Tax=Panagrellus redivivus TaxID=6233 RepID=A0A7E4W329_PANRE
MNIAEGFIGLDTEANWEEDGRCQLRFIRKDRDNGRVHVDGSVGVAFCPARFSFAKTDVLPAELKMAEVVLGEVRMEEPLDRGHDIKESAQRPKHADS